MYIYPPMTEEEFKRRTKNIAGRMMRLVDSIRRSVAADVIGKQLLRSATSIGANYRAACRGKSNADLIHKLSIVEEEADETLYWIELLVEAELVAQKKVSELMKEVDEVVAMTVASIKTLKKTTTTNPKSKI